MSTEVLLYIQLDLVNSEMQTRQVVDSLHQNGRVLSISTTYKRYRSDVQTDLSANVELVVRHASQLSVEEYVSHIEELEMRLTGKSKTQGSGKGPVAGARIELLNYGAMISMTPQLTLPSPLLLTDEVVRKCAAEVWGDYPHPIMKKSLAEMAAEVRLENNTEFFRQGTNYPGIENK